MASPVKTPSPSRDLGVTPKLAGFILLAILTGGVYWQVAKNGFINFDDPDYVSANARVQAGLRWESIKWALTSTHSSNWHPITWLSHMVDCQIYGLKPAGHHVTNAIFHLFNSLLLFQFLSRTTRLNARSFLVAALFALHPLHVESVAWVAERKDVLSTFFFLLTLLAYAGYANHRKAIAIAEGNPASFSPDRKEPSLHLARTHIAFYLLALFLFALGLMSKPMLVTTPFVLLLLDVWPLQRISLHNLRTQSPLMLHLFTEKLPFFALSVASCVITFIAQRSSGAVVSLANSSGETRLLNAIVAYGQYVLKTFCPLHLSVFYPYPNLSWSDLTFWTSLGALAITTLILFRSASTKPYLFVGWCWFLGTLIPVIGFVQVGRQAWADRYSYLPHIGLFVCLVWAIGDLVPRFRLQKWLLWIISASVLAGCFIFTSRQLSYWRDTRALFQHATEVTSGNYIAHAVLGADLVERGDLSAAIEECKKALEIAPKYPEAFNTLGNIYTRQTNYDQAIAAYEKAEECDPNYADPYNGLADLFLKQKQYARAEQQARVALRLSPMHLPAIFSLAMALHNQGKFEEAADYYRKLINLSPALFTPHRYLGNVYLAQGRIDDAISEYNTALKLRPNDAETHTVLAAALLQENHTPEATQHLLKATRIQPLNAAANYQLALVYQTTRQIAKAIDCYRKTIEVEPQMIEALNNLSWLLAVAPDKTLRNGAEAVTLAERACNLTSYQEPVLIGTLAAAYAEAGRFDDAIKAGEKARALALATGNQQVAKKNLELLSLYRDGRPYHEPE